MHASIWTFKGDPDTLAAGYDAIVATLPPGAVKLQLCLRTADGIKLVDTCPDEPTFRAFAADPGFRSLLDANGLGQPESIEDHPVHRAIVA